MELRFVDPPQDIITESHAYFSKKNLWINFRCWIFRENEENTYSILFFFIYVIIWMINHYRKIYITIHLWYFFVFPFIFHNRKPLFLVI